MLRMVLRLVGLFCLCLAFAAMVIDGTRSIAAGAAAIEPLGRTTSALFPDLFGRMHSAIETHAPILWDPILVTLLLLPGWLVIGTFGLVLVAMTRRRRARIGYAGR